MNNLVPAHYRSVSVADVEVDLTPGALARLLVGREAYRRTAYIVARRGAAAAVLEVTKASPTELFSPILGVEILAGPDDCALVESPGTDVGVPTQIARAAGTLAPGRRCVVVSGRYRHVSFILDPRPLVVRVVEVAPPEPPKLLDQAQRLLEVSEDLPPIELRPDVVDLVDLAATRPSDRYLFPCRGSGTAPAGAEVSYLDQRPERLPWVLVGCERSRQFHRWFYGDRGADEPPAVDMCPRELARSSANGGANGGVKGGPTLTKCCLLEEGVVRDGNCVVVPWGASLEEVREGLREVARVSEPAWAPV
ncbi:MAG TPA: hypothetical protein VKL22_05470 [Actinomycetota bacterium]|nr:hypothetical protein [Actinomycetota bacterium]